MCCIHFRFSCVFFILTANRLSIHSFRSAFFSLSCNDIGRTPTVFVTFAIYDFSFSLSSPSCRSVCFIIFSEKKVKKINEAQRKFNWPVFLYFLWCSSMVDKWVKSIFLWCKFLNWDKNRNLAQNDFQRYLIDKIIQRISSKRHDNR